MRATLDADGAAPPVRRAIRGLAALEAAGRERPIVLGYYPVDRGNPFQALLYRNLAEHGILAVGLERPEQALDLAALARTGARIVLHLHWTNAVLRDAADEADAAERVAAFATLLDSLRAAGVGIAWTIHNVLPHDSRFPDLDTALQRAIVERADVVHALAARTGEVLGGALDIPAERMLHVPHPSYRGAYPDMVTRDEARARLGIDPDELVLASLGSLRPYKGLGDLLDAFDALLESDLRRHSASRPARRLVVAGRPTRTPGTPELLARCAIHPRVLLVDRRLEIDEVQVVLRAADVVVLPYERSLNSGVLLLALTFGIPVVAPDGPGPGDLVEPAFGRTFRAGDVADLERALGEADHLARADARAAAAAAARRYDPEIVSDAFAAGLRSRLEAVSEA